MLAPDYNTYIRCTHSAHKDNILFGEMETNLLCKHLWATFLKVSPVLCKRERQNIACLFLYFASQTSLFVCALEANL